MFRAVGSLSGLAAVLHNLGLVAVAEGDPTERLNCLPTAWSISGR